MLPAVFCFRPHLCLGQNNVQSVQWAIPFESHPNDFLHFSLNVGRKPAGSGLISNRDSIASSLCTWRFQECACSQLLVLFSSSCLFDVAMVVVLISQTHLCLLKREGGRGRRRRGEKVTNQFFTLEKWSNNRWQDQRQPKPGILVVMETCQPAERWALSAVGGKKAHEGKLNAIYPVGSDCMSAVPPRDEGWKDMKMGKPNPAHRLEPFKTGFLHSLSHQTKAFCFPLCKENTPTLLPIVLCAVWSSCQQKRLCWQVDGVAPEADNRFHIADAIRV